MTSVRVDLVVIIKQTTTLTNQNHFEACHLRLQRVSQFKARRATPPRALHRRRRTIALATTREATPPSRLRRRDQRRQLPQHLPGPKRRRPRSSRRRSRLPSRRKPRSSRSASNSAKMNSPRTWRQPRRKRSRTPTPSFSWRPPRTLPSQSKIARRCLLRRSPTKFAIMRAAERKKWPSPRRRSPSKAPPTPTRLPRRRSRTRRRHLSSLKRCRPTSPHR